MILCEDTLVNWVDSQGGLLITRSKINSGKFDYNKTSSKLYVCITGYKQIINAFFTKILDTIKCTNVVLLIIESDVVCIERHWLKHPKLLHIYTWNIPFKHDKMTCLPICLNFNRQHDVIKKWLQENAGRPNHPSKLLCINSCLSTNPERVVLNNKAQDMWSGFCDILPYRKPSKSYYIPSHIEGKILINVTNSKCYDDWKDYKFILSPPGAGLDCHRTWEAILCGVIPIVKSSTIDALFDQLPVVIVENWDVITQQFLEKCYQEIHKKRCDNEYNLEKLNLEYWTHNIETLQRK